LSFCGERAKAKEKNNGLEKNNAETQKGKTKRESFLAPLRNDGIETSEVFAWLETPCS
jgi:hypothetical protein